MAQVLVPSIPLSVWLVRVSAAPLVIHFLLEHLEGKHTMVPARHGRELDGIPGWNSWLWNDLALSVMGTFGVNHQMEDLIPSTKPPPCHFFM